MESTKNGSFEDTLITLVPALISLVTAWQVTLQEVRLSGSLNDTSALPSAPVLTAVNRAVSLKSLRVLLSPPSPPISAPPSMPSS